MVTVSMALKTSPRKNDSADQTKEEKSSKNKDTIGNNDDIDRYNKKLELAEKINVANTLNKELKLRSKVSNMHEPVNIDPLPMPVYYPQCVTYPAVEWKVQNPIYTVPTIPVAIDSVPILGTHVLCPYVGNVVAPMVIPSTPALIPDGVPTSRYMIEEIPTTSSFVYEPTSFGNKVDPAVEVSRDLMYYDSNQAEYPAKQTTELENRLESYLTLPKELFPPTKALNLDPNALIDEFCKMKSIKQHTSWILDLEFGVPKSPITRPIPSYNPKFNSIHCKNAPGAIHPGFESCNDDFKRALLFYYDCIVSSLYRGYIIMNCDRSVENFQSWLLFPMQTLGMCWL